MSSLFRARADRIDRVQKLKDARSEAAKEIEEYKAKKEAEYKKFESEVCRLRYNDQLYGLGKVPCLGRRE